tara:strand:+ start:143 stop:388 length:246 start_codon:yes stop_codon:yes gene_type:complete
MRYDQLSEIQSRHSRLIELVREGEHSTPYISSSLGVSEQTIYRDIDYLRKSGVAIKAVRVERNWAYRIEEDGTASDKGKES